MTDIVERLRTARAAEIERLRAEIGQWKEAAKSWSRWAVEIGAEIERLRAELAEWEKAKDVVMDRDMEIMELKTEIERLRARDALWDKANQDNVEAIKKRDAEIERLQAERDMAEDAAQRLSAENEQLQKDNEWLRERYDVRVAEVVREREAEIERLRAELASLKEGE